MEGFAELMQRLLEIQNDEKHRSPQLIADDERLMDGLYQRILAGNSARTATCTEDSLSTDEIPARLPLLSWQESFRQAVLETDWTKMPRRIQAAEFEIQKRLRLLAENRDGTSAEGRPLAAALNSLTGLRNDAASWLARQNPPGEPQQPCPFCVRLWDSTSLSPGAPTLSVLCATA
jgi:hypothetical protein